MTNSNENALFPESIKNSTSNNIDDFHRKLKIMLEKDEFGFFKLKSKKALDQKILLVQNKIQKLLDLKSRSEQIHKGLTEKKRNLLIQNKKLKESLIAKLEVS
jgi:hypothetical protein